MAGYDIISGKFYVIPLSGEEEKMKPILLLGAQAYSPFRMDAIKAAAKDRGMPKNELYRLLCEEK